MLISKLNKTGAVWGLAGFLIGVVLTVTVGGGAALTVSTLRDKAQNGQADSAVASSTVPALNFVLPVVRNDEIDVAVQDFPIKGQALLREEVAKGTYRLLWLTAWDWDTAEGEPANTILISTDGYRQLVKLNNRRTHIAIREPKSGSIEMRGVFTADGNINISLLSGTQPIALPRMAPDTTTKINVEAGASSPIAMGTSSNIPSLPED